MRFAGKHVIAVLFALVVLCSLGLVLWTKHTPMPSPTQRQPVGTPLPGVLN